MTGNRLFGSLFPRRFSDMLSGFRALSRRFVKSFPALATGFETETELTIHALELRMPVAEVQVRYAARQPGSFSKLSAWGDGLRILAAVIFLFKEARPFKFFGVIAAILAIVVLALGLPVVETCLRTGLVPRFPTTILISAIMVIAAISLLCGIILDTVSRGRREAKRMRYLAVPTLARSRDAPR